MRQLQHHEERIPTTAMDMLRALGCCRSYYRSFGFPHTSDDQGWYSLVSLFSAWLAWCLAGLEDRQQIA